ncbi:MAG: precorrin-6Y C5,15-methyltransferase (decarboxylating) subunit CbiT, partial [Oligoflexus sp.]
EVFGTAYVSFIPHLASIQLAFAAAKIPWADARLLSVHGRSLEGLVARSRRERKLALLTDAEQCPQRIADHLITFHDTAWQATLCEDLGGVDERVRSLSLEDLRQLPQVHPLNVLLLERPTSWKAPSPLLYAEEAAFAKRMPKLGLITKREIRLLSLGALRLQDDSVIWDIGAGSGSVGIEAALLAAEGRCYAIECDAEGQDICMAHMKQFGADNVRLIPGRAPDVLDGLEDPDAVFVGGSKGRLEEILATSWARLKPQGRLVVNAITLENVSAAIQFFQESSIAYDLQLVQIARSQDLAGIYHRYEALNPIHIFAATKGEHAAAR